MSQYFNFIIEFLIFNVSVEYIYKTIINKTIKSAGSVFSSEETTWWTLSIKVHTMFIDKMVNDSHEKWQ